MGMVPLGPIYYRHTTDHSASVMSDSQCHFGHLHGTDYPAMSILCSTVMAPAHEGMGSCVAYLKFTACLPAELLWCFRGSRALPKSPSSVFSAPRAFRSAPFPRPYLHGLFISLRHVSLPDPKCPLKSLHSVVVLPLLRETCLKLLVTPAWRKTIIEASDVVDIFTDTRPRHRHRGWPKLTPGMPTLAIEELPMPTASQKLFFCRSSAPRPVVTKD